MRKLSIIFIGLLMGLFFLGLTADKPADQATALKETTPQLTTSKADKTSLNINRAWGKMPLYFIENQGQVDEKVSYYIKGSDKTIYFTPKGLTYVLGEPKREKGSKSQRPSSLIPELQRPQPKKSRSRWVVKLDFVEAQKGVKPVGLEKTQAKISYFKGNPKDWKTGLATYSQIMYQDLWPGIDLVYYGTMDRMKYEFIVHPGADPAKIQLAYNGVSSLMVNSNGQLEIKTPVGGFEDEKPIGYQIINGKQVDVKMTYALNNDSTVKTSGLQKQVYGFEIGKYNRDLPLILDPTILVYCGFIGGNEYDVGYAIARDLSNCIYVTGVTQSAATTFPETVGPDLTHNGSEDVFVAKVNPIGTALNYCGYIGGDGDEMSRGIAVDSSYCAYIIGNTVSGEFTFPVTVGPDLTHNGNEDIFVAKINTTGSGLLYCGFIGGSSYDYGYGIAVDSSYNAYVVGYVNSSEATFPVTSGPDLTYNGSGDAYVAKINSSGTGFVYSGYIGGSNYDVGHGIAVDSSGNVYVNGSTGSTQTSFPVTGGPDLTHNGDRDTFVAKVNSTGTGLTYCGYIGGSGRDDAGRIAIDTSGYAYVTGWTESTQSTFPVKTGPDLTHNGGNDAFVAKLYASGNSLVYCGYIGGLENETGKGIAVDVSGYAYVVGDTYSDQSSFPVVCGPDLTFNGGLDAYVVKLNFSGSGLIYCSYIGGLGSDYADGIVIDGLKNAYILGSVGSTQTTFPVKTGPDLTQNGGFDAYVAKIVFYRDDLLGSWPGQGVWYRNSNTGGYSQLYSVDADMVVAGDLNGDGIDDTIGSWPMYNGIWVKYAHDGSWARIGPVGLTDLCVGDMNGDGRDDVVGNFSTGVWYRDSIAGTWIRLYSVPSQTLTVGDLNEDDIDDLIGSWPQYSGLWVRYSGTETWAQIGPIGVIDLSCGDMNSDGEPDPVGSFSDGVWYRDAATTNWVRLYSLPATQIAVGDFDGDGSDDLLGLWTAYPGTWVRYFDGIWQKLNGTSADFIDKGKMR